MIEVKKISTAKAALGILALVIVAAAIAAYLVLHPDILKNILAVIGIACIILVILAVIVYIVMAVVALPMYVHKGEQVQTGATYSVDDVKGVGGNQEPVGTEEKRSDSKPGTKQ